MSTVRRAPKSNPHAVERDVPVVTVTQQDIDAQKGKASVIRAVDGFGQTNVLVGRLEDARPNLVLIDSCLPHLAAKLAQLGERLPAHSVFHGSIVSIEPLTQAHHEAPPSARGNVRMALTARARELRRFCEGATDVSEWPPELADVVQAYRTMPGPELGPTLRIPGFLDDVKKETNARLAVLSDVLYKEAAPGLEQTMAALREELRQLSPPYLDGAQHWMMESVRDVPFLRTLSRLQGELSQASFALCQRLEEGNAPDGWAGLTDLHRGLQALTALRMLSQGRHPSLFHYENQFAGGAGFAMVTMVNVARLGLTRFEEATGRAPTVDELVDVFERSRTLIRQMAAADLSVVRIAGVHLTIGAGALWHSKFFELVPEGPGYRVDFTAEAKAELSGLHNTWFDVPIDGATGCPAAVNFGEGNAINRLRDGVTRLMPDLFEAALRAS